MGYLLTIPGRLPNLNDYIGAERANRYRGAQMKRESGDQVLAAVRACLDGIRISAPVYMRYTWYERNRARDKDNISSFGRKVIQDSLVEAGVLKNDGWGCISGFSDEFRVDRENPRIEVEIETETKEVRTHGKRGA